ncbi:thiamine/thiamine pyrophosphate ABC transporter permease ThiP [Tateyamaria omphalii]|uniref:Thiamine/thiamine pyrophosphate ABC transporter permease ThiP n=1 Tax=Tateyamaria omphalii TaxID=299262 RepID=A0A1P8MYE7_9RHOB|nr:thiamine/thiamine pyrophosphate ABC transporter permease ThiP [Tateyamaria omphalii]APX13028.1 thiamine/thiamine pyrophosphate ABC transporter permease ThiP [Tateyamaria omphalii]
MARRAQPVSQRAGIIAAAFVVAVVIAAFVGISQRIETTTGLRAAEWQAVRFTVWQAFLSALISVVLAVPVARALARRRLPGHTLLVTLLGAPFILPVIVAVLGLLAIFGRNGWLNTALGVVGLPEVSIYGAHGVVLAHVFFNMPLATRLILQGWQSVPAEQFRIVGQLGLPPRMVFRVIEWPILWQVVPGAFALIFVICLTSFAVALTLGGGPRATTIELAIYQAFRFDFDLGRAAVLSLLQLAVAGAAAVLALWILPPIALQTGRDRAVRRWDAPAPWGDAFWIVLAAGFLLLPMLSIALSGVVGLFYMPVSVLSATWTTVWVACVSTVVLLVLALPMAAWLAQAQWGGAEALTLLGLVASPLMIGTGWFILIFPYVSPTAFALPVTALINAMMALPFAVRILLPAMRQVFSDYGRLSVGLGLRGVSLWRIVIIPRLRPQIGFAAGLTAALSVGDLGVVALFADPDVATLPLQMYRLMGAYRTEAAAGAALVLVALAFGMFWVCDAWGRRHAAG